MKSDRKIQVKLLGSRPSGVCFMSENLLACIPLLRVWVCLTVLCPTDLKWTVFLATDFCSVSKGPMSEWCLRSRQSQEAAAALKLVYRPQRKWFDSSSFQSTELSHLNEMIYLLFFFYSLDFFWNFWIIDVNGRELVIKASLEKIESHMVSHSHSLHYRKFFPL